MGARGEVGRRVLVWGGGKDACQEREWGVTITVQFHSVASVLGLPALDLALDQLQNQIALF